MVNSTLYRYNIVFRYCTPFLARKAPPGGAPVFGHCFFFITTWKMTERGEIDKERKEENQRRKKKYLDEVTPNVI